MAETRRRTPEEIKAAADQEQKARKNLATQKYRETKRLQEQKLQQQKELIEYRRQSRAKEAEEKAAANKPSAASMAADITNRAIQSLGGASTTRGSSTSGNMGAISSQTAYLILTRPNLSLPENYAHYHGFPSNITSKLGDLSGYTQVSSIHLEGIPCTVQELNEIDELLKEGIII